MPTPYPCAYHDLMRVSVRALLLNDRDELVVFRRTAPGRGEYHSLPGGKIESGEDDETALRREMAEELGATIGGLRYMFTIPGTPEFPSTHKFYVTRLQSMDLAGRTGTEFHRPEKGTYEVEEIPCTAMALKPFRWVPDGLAGKLEELADQLPGLCP